MLASVTSTRPTALLSHGQDGRKLTKLGAQPAIMHLPQAAACIALAPRMPDARRLSTKCPYGTAFKPLSHKKETTFCERYEPAFILL